MFLYRDNWKRQAIEENQRSTEQNSEYKNMSRNVWKKSELDCEKLRKGLGDVSRKLSNTLLKNVVDTYRAENQSICKAFEDIESKAMR